MIEIGSGKQPLQLATPVIGASGSFGYSNETERIVDLSKFGALVTNAITLKPRRVANGSRVVALDSGILLHTGQPNAGLSKIVAQHASKWKASATPIIPHLLGTSPDELQQCAQTLEAQEGVAGLEIGFHDEVTHRDLIVMLKAVRKKTHLPLLAQLPLTVAPTLASAAEEAGADALVVGGAPRGTARDPLTGQFMGGRLYGPWLKPLGVRAVGQVASKVKCPIIGAGGIFTPLDAREYLEAGAKAIQLDAVLWVSHALVDVILRDLGGLEMTRLSGAFSDEWWPGMGQTAAMRAQLLPSPPPLEPPSQLPR